MLRPIKKKTYSGEVAAEQMLALKALQVLICFSCTVHVVWR